MNAAHRWFLVLAACIIAPAGAFAQQPWTIALVPTLNPLPIGSCAAIHLTIFNAPGGPLVGEVPRNPLGFRVTMADFDVAVTAPDGSVLAQQTDVSSWASCACQGAAPGTVATVTLTYPGSALAAPSRVPGVAFTKSATFVLSKTNGTFNPPGCLIKDRPTITAPRGVAAPAPAAPPTAVALPPVAPAIIVAPVGSALPKTPVGSVPVRTPPYVAGPVTAALALSANGSWYEPGPITASLALSAHGSWYEPAPVTVTFGLSATGSWIERSESPVGTLLPAPPRR